MTEVEQERDDTQKSDDCLAAVSDERKDILRGWARRRWRAFVRRHGPVQDGGEKGPAEAGQSGGGPMGCFGHRRREEGE